MSTRVTLAYGRDFQLYRELIDDGHLYLELETTHYEASYGRILVEIPVHTWEVIRRRGQAELDLADKSDHELRQMVESKVDERIRRYQDAVTKGESAPFLAVKHFSFSYGPADTPRDQQIEMGFEHYVRRRNHQQQIRACIVKLEQAQSKAALSEDERI